MVALYVLPPVLKSLYGEKAVPPGASRTVDGRVFQVLEYHVGPDGYCPGTSGCPAESIQVQVKVMNERSAGWEPRPAQFQLQVEGVRTWLEAMDPVPGKRETLLAFAPSEERVLVLRFPLPLGASPGSTRPVAVHVTTPRARLDLDETLRR